MKESKKGDRKRIKRKKITAATTNITKCFAHAYEIY